MAAVVSHSDEIAGSIYGRLAARKCPRVERCEFPTILAVHFRVLDFLDGGIASSSRIDGLGRGVGEYLRSRLVDVPIRFLERGWI